MSTALAVTVTTPDGPFSIIADEEAVLASGWTADLEELRGLIHPDLCPEEVATVGVETLDATSVLAAALAAVIDYYAGDLAAPARVPVRQRSGEFLEAAWDALRQVAPGAPVSYTEFAARAGNEKATRAAANACARNAAALFVPCHRVLPAAGGVGSFRYGPDVKESLLKREAAQ